MFVYDRRRLRPWQPAELLSRLTPVQRSRLADLEKDGWRLQFVRGEARAAWLAHPEQGHAVLSYGGSLVQVPDPAFRSGDDRGARSAPADRRAAPGGLWAAAV